MVHLKKIKLGPSFETDTWDKAAARSSCTREQLLVLSPGASGPIFPSPAAQILAGRGHEILVFQTHGRK